MNYNGLERHKLHLGVVNNVNEKRVAQSVELSVVIPCFNEEGGLNELYKRVSSSCVEIVGENYEIVLVDDGSSDQTWSVISDFVDNDSRVVGVSLSRNFGHQLALSAGLDVCVGNRILVLDADLQDPPELLGKMMELMDQGADVVYGQRAHRHGETLFKRITALVFYRLLRSMTDVDIPVDVGDFRLMSRRVCDQLLALPEKQRFIRGMVSWIGFKQVPLLYERQVRFSGDTKYPLKKMILFAVDAITSFSISPIRLSVHFSLVLAALTVLLLMYVVGSWVFADAIPGWASLGVIISLIGTGQFLMLGMLGEYIGRIYMEAKGRPLFVIDRIKRRPPKG